RAHHRRRADLAVLRDDAADGARPRAHALDRALQMEARTVRDGGPREGVGGLLGIGVAVAGRVHAAHPVAGEAGNDGAEVTRAGQPRLQAELARDRQPRLEAGHAAVVGGEREVTALDPLDVGAQLARQAAPEAVRLHHERHLDRIAPLLADEAPVLSRLLAGHGPALEHDDARATAGEEIPGGAADNAGPDDDDVRVTLHRSAAIVGQRPGRVKRGRPDGTSLPIWRLKPLLPT